MGSMTVQRPTTTTYLTAGLLSLLLLLEGLQNNIINNNNGLLLVKAFHLPSQQQPILSSTDRRIIKSSSSSSSAAQSSFRRHDERTTTALFMGLRDFLRGRLPKMGEKPDNRKLKLPPPVRDEEEEEDIYAFLDDDDDYDDDLSSSATRSLLEDYMSEDDDDDDDDNNGENDSTISASAPLRMGEDPESKEINVFSLDEKESVQERINRVKSGKMSEEEKQAFLKTSLSTGAEARRLPLRPPSAESYYTAASPFPGDPIMRSIAGQKNNADSSSEQSPISVSASAFAQSSAEFILDKQKKKRDYLDMVTNPNRFDIYRTAATARLGGGSDGRTASITEAEASAKDAAAAVDQAAGRSSAFSIGQVEENEGVEEEEEEEASSSPNTTASDKEAKSSRAPLPADLGARLGAAALAYEESRQKEKARAAAEASSAATVTPNNKKPEKELTTFEKAAQQKLEQARMQKQMQVQDDYWTKRLAAERAAREKAEAEGLKQQVDGSKNPAWQRFRPKQGGSAKIQDLGTAAAQKTRAFNPDERELLSQAQHDRDEAWDINQAVINRSAARKDGSVPMDTVASSLNDVQTEQQFINEQARRRANTDMIRDEQLERLRSLSSPLPSPAPRTNRGNINPSARGVVPAPSSNFRPRQSSSQANGPTGGTWRSSSAKYKVDQSVDYLKNNMNDVRRQQEASKIASGTQPSLNDVVRQREEKPTYQQMLSSLNDVQNSGRSPAAGTTGIKPLGYTNKVNPSPGIRPMGDTKKDPPAVDSVRVPPKSSTSSSSQSEQQEVVDSVRVPSESTASSSSQSEKQEQAPEPPLPVETSRPAIRMKLPLQDVDDEDDEEVVEEGIDARANRNMSIAEAMNRTTGGSGKSVGQDERSRKWGVDMSKFT